MGFPVERVSVIVNGVPRERVKIVEDRASILARGGWQDRTLLAWAARADSARTLEKKDLQNLLDAVAQARERHPQVLLILIGPTRDEIASAGFELPDWAVPIGWQERPADYMNAADAFVISSRTEGVPNVAAEALMLGLPVVTTDCGGHCATVRRSGGKVVPTEDAAALASAISEALERPPQRSTVREVGFKDFSAARLIEETLAVYRRLMALPRSSR